MNNESAEILALNGLSFIAENEKYLTHYLNISGITLEQLKKDTSNPQMMPGILASVLDFLLQNEKYLIEFAEKNEIDPQKINQIRHHFPGAIIPM